MGDERCVGGGVIAQNMMRKNYLSFEEYAVEMLGGSTTRLPVPIVNSSSQGLGVMALPAGTIIGVQVCSMYKAVRVGVRASARGAGRCGDD